MINARPIMGRHQKAEIERQEREAAPSRDCRTNADRGLPPRTNGKTQAALHAIAADDEVLRAILQAEGRAIAQQEGARVDAMICEMGGAPVPEEFHDAILGDGTNVPNGIICTATDPNECGTPQNTRAVAGGFIAYDSYQKWADDSAAAKKILPCPGCGTEVIGLECEILRDYAAEAADVTGYMHHKAGTKTFLKPCWCWTDSATRCDAPAEPASACECAQCESVRTAKMYDKHVAPAETQHESPTLATHDVWAVPAACRRCYYQTFVIVGQPHGIAKWTCPACRAKDCADDCVTHYDSSDSHALKFEPSDSAKVPESLNAAAALRAERTAIADEFKRLFPFWHETRDFVRWIEARNNP